MPLAAGERPRARAMAAGLGLAVAIALAAVGVGLELHRRAHPGAGAAATPHVTTTPQASPRPQVTTTPRRAEGSPSSAAARGPVGGVPPPVVPATGNFQFTTGRVDPAAYPGYTLIPSAGGTILLGPSSGGVAAAAAQAAQEAQARAVGALSLERAAEAARSERAAAASDPSAVARIDAAGAQLQAAAGTELAVARTLLTVAQTLQLRIATGSQGGAGAPASQAATDIQAAVRAVNRVALALAALPPLPSAASPVRSSVSSTP